jgi:hypothetical protein
LQPLIPSGVSVPVWPTEEIAGGVVVQDWPPAMSWPSVRQASAAGNVRSATLVPVVVGDDVRKIEFPDV